MIPLEDALACVDRVLGDRRVARETVPVRQAAGRFLAVDQHSKLDLPPFDKAAMDGYAIATDDVRGEYRVAGIVAAGQPGMSALGPDEALKVMTGAPVPHGATRVIMVEQAVERDGRVRFENASAAKNICRQAEDVAVGQTILRAGSRLEPLHIANLIGCGISEVQVARPVRVAIIATGDEIVSSAAELGPGKIMNTNGPLLAGLARTFGLSVISETSVPDDESKLAAAMQRGLAEADVVVLTGGVSAGDYDFVPDVIADCNLEIHFSRVAVKPGKPTVFASGKNEVLFGLPGNPVAVYLTFHLFVLRATARLSGGDYEPREVKLRLAADFARRATVRTEYAPGRITPEGCVETLKYHGSAHLAALMEADGFLVVPRGVETLKAGAEVTFAMLGIGDG